MKKFAFSARNQQGKIESGTEEAESADAMVERLQLRGLIVTSVHAQAESKPSAQPQARAGAKRIFSHNRIKEDDLIIFGRQLATAVGSGVPLLKSMDVISRQAASRKFYAVLSNITHDVESGFSFRDALARYPKVFSSLWINMVETGEASGNLPIVLEKLVVYLESRAAFKRKIISALIYPVILFAVAFSAILVFLLFIVPKFTKIFEGFGKKLPLPTQILVSISEVLGKNFFLLFLAIGVIIFMTIKFVKTQAGKRVFDNFLLKVPLFKEFFRLSEIERFAASMTTLLESGVPILYSLEIAERSAGNVLVQEIIRKVKDNVREGRTLVAPMEESAFFPPMITQMVSIGEEIGEIDKMFKKIAIFYSEMLETQVARFTTLFEPLMIVFMGVVIGGMVISMFIPIFEIANIGG